MRIALSHRGVWIERKKWQTRAERGLSKQSRRPKKKKKKGTTVGCPKKNKHRNYAPLSRVGGHLLILICSEGPQKVDFQNGRRGRGGRTYIAAIRVLSGGARGEK